MTALDVPDVPPLTAVELHAAGYSWTEIGRELGVTRQAARQRWGR